jgi:predicted permease
LRAAQITAGFFETMGVAAERGRLPAVDELSENGPRVVVISDGLWQRRFGSDPGIIGRTVILDHVPHVVIGVMPPAMRFPGDGPDIWVSALYESQDATPWKNRAVRWLSVVGRLAPGATADEARRNLAAFQRTLAQQYPDADEGWTGARVVTLRESLIGDVRPALLILFAAAGCVLLVASANIAMLLLARGSARAREFALRAALGAPRGRIVRQILTECFMLSLAGAAAGAVIAGILGPLLARLAAGEMPEAAGRALDWTVAAFTLVIAGVSALVLGLPLVWHVLSDDTAASLASGGAGTRGATSGRRRVRSRHLLVVVEVAIAVVLVCGASLMAKSFDRLLAANTGFQPAHALTVGLDISDERYPDPRQLSRYYQTILDRVSAVPGVTAAGATKILPLRGKDEPWGFGIDGEPILPRSQRLTVTVNHVSAGYFHAVETPVLAGREFARGDTMGMPQVVIVNDVFAHRYLPGPLASAPGRSLVFGDSTRVRVVGVVQGVHETGLDAAPGPAAYLPNTQNQRGSVVIVARVRNGDPLSIADAVQQAIWSADKDQTITSIGTLDDVVQQAVARPRLLSLLLAGFGVIGLILGALGIYGLVAYAVDARRQEIGVRVALGASRRNVLMLVVGHGLVLAMSGITIGLVLSLIATRVMRAVLFSIGPSDPVTYIEVVAALAIVAALATYLPARRALAVDPVRALSTS